MDEFPEQNEFSEEPETLSSNSSEMEEVEEITIDEQVEENTDRLDVLINLLIKKNLITEEEIQAEYDSWIKEKESEDENF